jgi:hypothetical protein
MSTTLLVLSTMGADLPRPTTPPPGLRYYYAVPLLDQPKIISTDVCVYGGTPGGVMAAIQARRQGKSAVLVVFRRHVGGMTSGGLTATDLGNAKAIGGLSRDFFHRVGKDRNYRPSEAERVFLTMLQEAHVPVYFEHRLKDVTKEANVLKTLICENGNRFAAKVFVDATYEGDLLAKAGVTYTVGREANRQYGETLNGIQHRDKHQFLVPVDPYRIEGTPESGLLWGVSAEPLGQPGDADQSLQAYNFRMWLSDKPDRQPFPKPTGYDRNRYQLLLRYVKAVNDDTKWQFRAPYGPFQVMNGDCNNDGGFSTDYIGGNTGWPEADYPTREQIFQDHVNYQQGLVWFVGNDPEVPQSLRDKLKRFGPAAGEFPETKGWPHELYVREGRRLVAAQVMTENHCLSKQVVDDSIGLASYNMDSHNCRRLVVEGKVRNEGDVQVRCPTPYPVSYRSIVPHEKECANLLVPVCLSASHIAYGSIRMEPVFMILGQSAGTAACLAIDQAIPVQHVKYPELKERLLNDKQILSWTSSREGKR